VVEPEVQVEVAGCPADVFLEQALQVARRDADALSQFAGIERLLSTAT